jgi:predicted nuclease of predicted toxin-antitoxin system
VKFLLDNGLPLSAASLLEVDGYDTIHVSSIGMSSATDDAILDRATADGRVVVTLDADFHTLLALSGASAPSVIRIRQEGLKGGPLALLVSQIARRFTDELENGAAISVGPKTARCRRLPLK